jgi:magnesium-transporting ATPase (P-type)
MVFAGTFVAAGSAHAVVVATGARTRLGGIATLTGDVVRRPTPLKQDLDRAVRIIAVCAVTAGVLFFGVSLVLGTPARDGFLFSVGVIVALVPEGLLPTLTLALAMSATRMAHRGALVRRPESVETLGATTVICSDKTGTMTTSQMTARALIAAGHEIRATRSGWAPGGVLLEHGRPLVGPALKDARPALLVASMCGDARQVAATQLDPAHDPLGQRHEEQGESDEQQRELRGQPGVLGGEVAADRNEREQDDVRDDGEGVQPREEDERYHPQSESWVPIGSNVALDAEDLGRCGQADEHAREQEGDDDQPRHVEAHVVG